MADGTTSKAAAAELTIRDDAAALAASRREFRNLAVLLALPAMWANQAPADIATGLLDVLCGVFHLESGYVRCDDPAGGPTLERWRPAGARMPIELEQALATVPTRANGALTSPVRTPDVTPPGDNTIRVTSMRPALTGEDVLVLIASRRPTFPTEFEMHQLRIIVAQATVSIHTARRLASEYAARVAAETALQLRNDFLASLAQELRKPLTSLAERAAQAQAFATEGEQAPALAEVVGPSPVMLTDGALWPQDRSPAPARPTRLSRREGEVLGLLAQGLSNKEIAGILSLSHRTVERHITGLYRKIGAQRRSEATVYAMRNGFVPADQHQE